MFLIREQIANPYRGLGLSSLLDLSTNSKPPGLILSGVEYLSDRLKSSELEGSDKPSEVYLPSQHRAKRANKISPGIHLSEWI